MDNKKYLYGLLSGIAGGLVFGVALAMLGMLPAIAGIVNSNSVAAGFAVHLSISAIIGIIYAWWFGDLAEGYGAAAGYGILHGFIWWILGGLVLLPLILGLGVSSPFSGVAMLSLAGHLIYGLVLGVSYGYFVVYKVHKMREAH